jgi:hypothetical protein
MGRRLWDARRGMVFEQRTRVDLVASMVMCIVGMNEGKFEKVKLI